MVGNGLIGVELSEMVGARYALDAADQLKPQPFADGQSFFVDAIGGTNLQETL